MPHCVHATNQQASLYRFSEPKALGQLHGTDWDCRRQPETTQVEVERNGTWSNQVRLSAGGAH
jgi:hypothetical protein